jgi:two-component system heavy metal sensor histidine kinase CusS
LNDLLGRLDDTLSRERAFSANVAHELRTPLAGLRSTIEVALAKPRESAEYQQVLDTCLEICQQTAAITDNLLALARLDAGHCEVHREPVQLLHLLHETWAPLAGRAELQSLTVDWQLQQVTLITDPSLLRLVLGNLFDNAVCYADSGGRIAIGVVAQAASVDIRVENTAGQLSPELAERVFDRFWRGDSSRTETGRHAGLGLSLCHDIARLLDGLISVSVQDTCFRVRLRLPRSRPVISS